MKDYSAAELEALAALGKQRLMDGWAGFPSAKPCDVTRAVWPELADDLDILDARMARLRRGCASLFKRGLVERRRSWLDGRWFDYRLIEPLRAGATDTGDNVTAQAVEGGEQ